MSDTVIQVENLSKRYILAHEKASGGHFRYQRFSDVLINAAKIPLKAFKRGAGPSETREEFWALRDVSFEIKRGEVTGIVGRNGAGKSTLLKILSRITEPTSGRVEIDGRVASLLEVGTGFHPELTGRENIYLNGAILGMTRREITKKFDEIVAFAEVEKFLDTPVRFYSSGMYVRLAFAVAAHLEPEILIVDEVLAVGDAQFQKKCLGKMQDVSVKDGRTVLFVSHNMGVIGRLCQRSILMNSGRVQLCGPTGDIIPLYLKAGVETTGSKQWDDSSRKTHDPRLKLQSVQIIDSEGNSASRLDKQKSFAVEIKYHVVRPLPQFRVTLRFHTSEGIMAFATTDSTSSSYDSKSCEPGFYKAQCLVPANLLNEGTYSLSVAADIPFQKLLFFEENAVELSAEQTESRFSEKWPGVVSPLLEWETKRLPK
jgi:lipopolysaccharide transport system ATP-binding protein